MQIVGRNEYKKTSRRYMNCAALLPLNPDPCPLNLLTKWLSETKVTNVYFMHHFKEGNL